MKINFDEAQPRQNITNNKKSNNMSHAYRISDQESAYFLTFQVVGWVDIFTRKVYRDIVIESLQYCQKEKGLQIYAYVIMSNHIHLVVSRENGDLSGFVRDFKSFTSREILKAIDAEAESRRDWLKIVFAYHGKFKAGQTFQIWTHENHAVELYSSEFVAQKINYIHQNPVQAGIVAKPEDYLYSSAVNYAGLDGLIEVVFV